MRTFGFFIFSISILSFIITISTGISGKYKLERDIMSYWNLADKASTIEKKSEYIDKFVEALEKESFNGKYNAIIFPTLDNSFDANFEVLKTFQSRLKQIQSMDIKSFEYQTAIQQITQQEQGEAEPMLSVFKGIWWKSHYFLLWNWICAVQVILTLVIFIFGIIFIQNY